MIEDDDARRVAQILGGIAGYSSDEDPNTIVGTNGLWEFDVSEWGLSPSAERIASAGFIQEGVDEVDLSGLLHRNADSAHPEYNRMNTAIDMNGNDINNARSEEHTSELQSLMRISYAVFCLKKKTKKN